MRQLLLLYPELLLTVAAFVVWGADLFLPVSRRGVLPYLALAGLATTFAAALPILPPAPVALFGGQLMVDGLTWFFRLLLPLSSAFVIVMSLDVVRKLRYRGEYYGLILIATVAMMLMAAAGQLLTAYIALELLNFVLYVLAAYDKDNPKSNEAGLKYILLSALASALLLYGAGLVYGSVRTTYYAEIAQALAAGAVTPGLALGLALLLAGLAFKLAAVPFHMWTPDIYEGAPLPVTAFISTAAKAAGLVLALRLLAVGLLPLAALWVPLLALLAVLTMTVGNLLALQQRNVKRLLAYSSIAQVGYLLVGLAALPLAPGGQVAGLAVDGLLLHLAGYAAGNLAAFLAVTLWHNATGSDDLDGYAGMAERAPLLAFGLAVALLSLAGMPLFAGFTTKFYLFTAAAQHGLLWLVAVALVNSLISLYYYLAVLRELYITPAPEAERLHLTPLTPGVLAALLAVVFWVGLAPGLLLQMIGLASAALGGV
ncbi:MAG: NADH-quinone oxidoreductase subunit N [Chloroflexi bacterium]|nr:NADH-quinone oxidoreductase subunit N [Chloroflexota bacterium]